MKTKKFMKANYSKLLTKIAGIVGVSGASLLITLPSTAEQVRNPQSDLRQENLYSHHHGNHNQKQSNTQSNTQSKTQVAQSGGNGILNPRPSIFNEPPYNGRRVEPDTNPEERTTPAESTEPGMTKPDTGKEPSQATEAKNVIEVIKVIKVAKEKPVSFKTLLTALEKAELLETLQGEGPFTIFAPTDAAFAKLPQDAVQDLLKPENQEVLIKILTYHVVPGKVKSTDLKSGEVKSLQGDSINVKVADTGVMVNDAQVIQPDIQAPNGVIHVIDTVILPPSL